MREPAAVIDAKVIRELATGRHIENAEDVTNPSPFSSRHAKQLVIAPLTSAVVWVS